MADDLDPAAVERAARGLFLHEYPGNEGAWDAPGDFGRAWRAKARVALTAARAGEPAPVDVETVPAALLRRECDLADAEMRKWMRVPVKTIRAALDEEAAPVVSAEQVSSLADALRAEVHEHGSDGSTFEAVIRAWLGGDYDGPAPVKQSQYGMDLAEAVREARARGEVLRG